MNKIRIRFMVITVLFYLFSPADVRMVLAKESKPRERIILFAVLSQPGLKWLGDSAVDYFYTMIDPIASLQKGKVKDPGHWGTDTDSVWQKFETEFYSTGRKYAFFFGGTKKGSVSVIEPTDEGEFNAARVKIFSSVHIGGNIMAIASNTDKFQDLHLTRRKAMADERTKMLALARARLLDKKVPSEFIRALQVDNLTAYDTQDSQVTLVGTFHAVRDSGPLDELHHYSLFLVVEKSAGSYQVRHNWYNYSGGDERNVVMQYLVDMIDVDNDGKAEVVTRFDYWENHPYRIYDRQGNKWVQIYEGGGGGL